VARRHRKPARLSPRARRTLLGLAMIAVLAPVAGVALGAAIDEVKQCRENVTLTVAAAPEIAPVLTDHAQSWSATAPPTDGTCVTVKVSAVDSPSMASAYAKRYDAEVDVGAAHVADVELADVWVPESLTWLARLGGDLDGAFNPRFDSVAESPVGFGVTQEQAKNPQQMILAETPVNAADPRVDAASLELAMTAQRNQRAEVSYDPEGATVMSQAAVTEYNVQHPDKPLIFTEPQPMLSRFEYPYVTQSNMDDQTTRASDAFRSSLLSNDFTQRLPKHGLLIAGPYPQLPDPKLVESALKSWQD
jgi:hypothetical protein